MTNTTIFS